MDGGRVARRLQPSWHECRRRATPNGRVAPSGAADSFRGFRLSAVLARPTRPLPWPSPGIADRPRPCRSCFRCRPNTEIGCKAAPGLPCADLVSFISLLNGGSFSQGGSLPRRWTAKTQASLWLEARWQQRDPQGRGSPRQTHPLREARHALRPRRPAAPCRPSGAAGKHGSCRCARRGRTDQQSATSLLQQPLHSHVHSPDAVSLVPVEFRPTALPSGSSISALPLSLRHRPGPYNRRSRFRSRIRRPTAMTSMSAIGPRTLKPVTQRHYHQGVPTGVRPTLDQAAAARPACHRAAVIDRRCLQRRSGSAGAGGFVCLGCCAR